MSDRIALPVANGVFRPMIVLPMNFVATEPDDCLEAALAHEWAHIQNGDLRWLALLRLLNVVLFAHPLFWLLRRMIRADQEALADAAASTLHGDGRLAYAETLVGWARSSYRHQPGALASAALALWERPSMLHRRVRLLVDCDYRVEPATSRRWRLVAACLGTLVALLLSLVTLRPHSATAQEMKAQQAPQNPATTLNTKPRLPAIVSNTLAVCSTPTINRSQARKSISHTLDIMARPRRPSARRATRWDDSGFEVRKQDFVDTTYETPWTTAQVVATAAGFGSRLG